MDDKAFEDLVVAGIEQLPEQFQKLLSNVAIVIANEPNEWQRKEQALREDETLFGLYEGIPVTERGSEYGGVLPDKITIFKNPILETYSDPNDIKECVANTVWHECAHHFGFDEPWVEEEERKRGKTL